MIERTAAVLSLHNTCSRYWTPVFRFVMNGMDCVARDQPPPTGCESFRPVTATWRLRWTMDVGPPQPPTNVNRLSVDSAKGHLVIERMDSIRNLFGCELRVVDERRCSDGDSKETTMTFVVSRLDEYKPLDDQLIERLKVHLVKIL